MTNHAIAQASKDFVAAAERTTTLYALSEQYAQTVDLLEDPDADPQLIEQELDRLGGQIVEKAEAIAGLIRWYQGLGDLRGIESKRMAEGAAHFHHQAERLRAYVLKHMQLLEQDRIDTARFTLRVRQNPPHVEVLDAAQIPHQFNRSKITVEPDKTAIREHWKTTGEIVPGVDIVRTERLDIQ